MRKQCTVADRSPGQVSSQRQNHHSKHVVVVFYHEWMDEQCTFLFVPKALVTKENGFHSLKKTLLLCVYYDEGDKILLLKTDKGVLSTTISNCRKFRINFLSHLH